MQVRLTTARDFAPGISGEQLLDPATNVRVAMDYLEWSWNFLEARLGRRPSFSEWLGAYNAGVGNVLDRGFIPQAYVRRWLAARNGLALA